MANPAFNASDITVIDSADSTTGWAVTGQMSAQLDNDIFLQGTGSVGVEFKSVAQSTMLFTRTAGTIIGMHLRIWIWAATATAFNTIANFGLTIRVQDSGGDWGEWAIAGSDSGDWLGDGWKCICQDCDATFDRTSATAPTLTDIDQIGIGFDVVATLGKSNGLVVDQLMISASADTSDITGGVLEITSPSYTGNGSTDIDFVDGGGGNDTIVRGTGSWITDGFENGDTIVVSGTVSNDGEYVINSAPTATTLTVVTASLVTESNVAGTVTAVVTLQDIVTKDQVTDDTWYGHVHRDKNGNFELIGKMVWGDFSGALNTIIRDTGKTMIWADNFVGASQYQLTIVEDTGTTEITLGTEVGTGNDSKGVGGGLMRKNEEVFTFDYAIKAIDASPIFNWFGGVIQGASGGIRLEQTNIQWVSCLIASSGQITLSAGAEMREGFITDSIEVAGVGAILLNANPTDPEFRDMGLINNVHAIESETNGPTTLDLRNITYAGNTQDIRFNHTSGLLTVNVLEGGDTPTTSDGGGGGTITVLNPQTTQFTVQDTAKVVIANARVFAETGDGIEVGGLPFEEAVTTLTQAAGVATLTASAVHGLVTGDQVVVRGAQPDEYNKVASITVTSTTVFTYAVDSGISSPATGTLIFSYVPVHGLTNGSGVISTSKTWPTAQSLTGWARKKNAVSPLYKEAVLGVVDASGGTAQILTLNLDE